MAKKKPNLSPGELLDQAMVPGNEWPYPVPENWMWVRFGELATDIADGPFGSNLKREHYTDKREVRIIQLSNIGEDGWRDENIKYTTFEHLKTISRSRVNPGEIVIAKMMPAGRAIIVPNLEKSYVLSSDAIKFVPRKEVNTKYLLYAMNSNDFRNQISSETQGITRARTSIGKLRMYAFPLPPISEQQRIVDRIESLYEKLDQAKELIKDALDSFENRKAAILHKAFSGELTKKWREENGLRMESWKEKTFEECTIKITDGFHNSPKPVDSGFPYIMAGHVKPFNINYHNGMFMDEKNHRELFNKANPQKGDVLLVNIGAGTGTPSVIDVDFEFSFKNCAILKPKNLINSFFMFYYLLFIQKEVLAEITRGGAQPFLSLKQLKKMTIILPDKVEQDQIVTLLNDIFSIENNAQEALDIIYDIELMKKTILARAFRGKLGTNDPKEESALSLLKEVISNR